MQVLIISFHSLFNFLLFCVKIVGRKIMSVCSDIKREVNKMGHFLSNSL